MCNHGEVHLVKVKIAADLSCNGQEKWKEMGIDTCIAPMVRAFQEAGIDMRGSCCGHGRGFGNIELADGSGLLILSRKEFQDWLSSLCAEA